MTVITDRVYAADPRAATQLGRYALLALRLRDRSSKYFRRAGKAETSLRK
jgi:hypothetical protein